MNYKKATSVLLASLLLSGCINTNNIEAEQSTIAESQTETAEKTDMLETADNSSDEETETTENSSENVVRTNALSKADTYRIFFLRFPLLPD